jgi:ectoine hydroxylase-related dioxygenase (phytanoyl-CoA dioxygenase family)
MVTSWGRGMTIDEYYGSDTSCDALAKFRRDGYALFPRLFSDAEVDDLLIRAMLKRGDARLRQEQHGARGTIIFWSAAVDPVLDTVRSAPRLFDIVAPVLGTTDIRQSSQQICCRDPATADRTGWHRDELALEPGLADPRRTSVALAIYLDDVLSIDQGAVLFVPGSHEWTAAEPLEAAAYARCEAMLPRRGMVGLWNAGTIHGSRPNTTHRDRRSLMHGYVRADATRDPDHVWTWKDGRALTYAEGRALA